MRKAGSRDPAFSPTCERSALCRDVTDVGAPVGQYGSRATGNVLVSHPDGAARRDGGRVVSPPADSVPAVGLISGEAVIWGHAGPGYVDRPVRTFLVETDISGARVEVGTAQAESHGSDTLCVDADRREQNVL